jgi:hypothetical protein
VGAWICVERGLGGIVIVTLVAIEVCVLSWWNDRGHVESGHGSRAPVDCARSHPSHPWERGAVVGGPVAHCLARQKYARGSGAFDDTTGAWASRRNVARGAHLTRDLSARFGWMEFVFCAVSD